MQDVLHSQVSAVVERKMDLARQDMRRNPHKLWGERNKRNVQHKLPKLESIPIINYDKLHWLCSIQGLQDTRHQTTKDAHRLFMEHVHSMFVKPPKKLGFPIHSEKRGALKNSTLSLCTSKATAQPSEPVKAPVKETLSIDSISHDIRDHMRLLHKERKSEDPELVKAENIKTVRRLLRKLPFERNATENEKIFKIMKSFPLLSGEVSDKILRELCTVAVLETWPFERNATENEKIFKIMKSFPLLSGEVSDKILRELCTVAVLETWKEDEFTVFGTTGFHVVLRGSVTPQSLPYLVKTEGGAEFRVPTPVLDESEQEILSVGTCFGTFEKIEGREPNSKILSVKTAEENCEFFKVTTSDYSRVIEQIRHREQSEKVNLLVSCGNYKLWPRQPLLKVADLIEWMKYPANTILVSEGYKTPYMAVIRSGECHVLRQVDIIQTLKNGKKEKKSKQVVMGKLKTSDSFAEISVLKDEPITCTVITASPVELGVITPDKVKDLDETTRQLFIQSNEQTFGKLTKDDIEEEYMQQELQKEWNEFKHNVVVDVINSRGIQPGSGKWSK